MQKSGNYKCMVIYWWLAYFCLVLEPLIVLRRLYYWLCNLCPRERGPPPPEGYWSSLGLLHWYWVHGGSLLGSSGMGLGPKKKRVSPGLGSLSTTAKSIRDDKAQLKCHKFIFMEGTPKWVASQHQHIGIDPSSSSLALAKKKRCSTLTIIITNINTKMAPSFF